MDETIKVRPSLKVPVVYGCIFLSLLFMKMLLLESAGYFVPLWRMSVLLGASLLGYLVLQRWTTVYAIQNAEVIESRGILARTVIRVPVSRVANVQIDQNLTQRFLKLADFKVDTPGNITFEIKMRDLDIANISRISSVLARLLEPLHHNTHREGGAVSADAMREKVFP